MSMNQMFVYNEYISPHFLQHILCLLYNMFIINDCLINMNQIASLCRSIMILCFTKHYVFINIQTPGLVRSLYMEIFWKHKPNSCLPTFIQIKNVIIIY